MTSIEKVAKFLIAQSHHFYKMKIFIDIMRRYLTVNVEPNTTIEYIKQLVSKETGNQICRIELLFNCITLKNENKIQDYNIKEGVTIRYFYRLRGGKPVIYLYPDKDDFKATVNIEMKKEEGEITSIYPVIKGNKKTWIVKANKNGEIIYNNRKYYYLFWECLFNKSFKIEEGFCIEGQKCFEFFEEKLDFLGLSEKEANDFITYWCPKMEKSKYVLICFQDVDYTSRVPLLIDPKPDSMKRIFMTFKLIHEKIDIPVQNLEKYKIEERKGFFVLEWGGAQIESND